MQTAATDKLTKGQQQALGAFWRGLMPDPTMQVDTWADEHRYLAETSSAEPGKFRTSRTPYISEPLQALSSNSGAERVVLMFGAQLSKTETGNNWIGYIMDYAPGPMLAVQPTVDIAKRFSKQRIASLISSTPRLRDKVRDSRSRDSGNTLLSKEFPGGMLMMAGANSAAGLRSMPVRYLFLDEVDAYPEDVEGEGDPIDLAIARTRTFARRKIFMCSTPTFEGRSKIAKAYDSSDQRKYWVPCPHCGEYQTLKWSGVTWPKGNPSAAVYTCEHCRESIHEHHKTKMLEGGEWRADEPERGGKIRGYQLSSLYAPVGWFSWGDAAEMWESAKGQPDKLRVFVNTVLGETWKEKSVQPDWRRLYERTRASGLVQNELAPWVLAITAGVDVQGDRLEAEIVGWGRRKRTQSIDYRVLLGDTNDLGPDGPWEKLRDLLEEVWPHPVAGVAMQIGSCGIDSGFNTQTVYTFCRSYQQPRVYPLKGQDALQTTLGTPKLVDINLGGRRISRGVRFWPVGSSIIKQEVYGWLGGEMPTDGENYPAGWCDFPEYDEEHFKGLTAEQLVVRVHRGYRRYQWEKTRERNEQLDCRGYARASAAMLGLDRWQDSDYDRMERDLGIGVPDFDKPKRADSNESRGGVTFKKSDYWS